MNRQGWRRAEVILGGLFLASWVVATAYRWFLPQPGTLDLDLYRLYAVAGVLGWAAGNAYVWRSKGLLKRARAGLLMFYFFGTLGVVFLAHALGSPERALEAPLAPLFSSGVFTVFFVVPVSLRPRGR